MTDDLDPSKQREPPGQPDRSEPDPEITLTWIRDYAGLTAYAPLPPTGHYPRDHRRRPRPRTARLRASDTDSPPRRPEGLLSDGDWAWAIAGEHTWTGFTTRFGNNGWRIALELARAGCITISHSLRGNALVHPPRRIHPHPDLAAAETDRRSRRRDNTTALAAQATALIALLTVEWPDAAAALRATTNPERLQWAVHAAQDLADGTVHDSVRAFVQAHATHTKARDDVHHLLAELGFTPDTLATLGLARSPYIGIGGPIRLLTTTGMIDLIGLPGPHDIRLSPQHPVRPSLPDHTPTLLIIENRQAAETMCDLHPDLPVVWCHGQPPPAVLTFIRIAAEMAAQTIICTDADLGGVRIAARILDRLPDDAKTTIVDIGETTHDPGRPFSTYSRNHLEQLINRTDHISQFAHSCLTRGYAIEQEATTRAALRNLLA